MSPRPRVLFLGTHGQHNIGDELLLETFLDALGADAEYTVNSYDVAATAAQLRDRYEVSVIDTARDRIDLWRALGRSDAVVFGGGSIVKELYASVGRNRYATLVMLWAVVFAARIRRVPVAMLNIGVGPIRSRIGRFLAARVLRRADLLTVRDAGSAELCAQLGVRAQRSVDAVFSADADAFGGAAVPADRGGRLRIALNLNIDVAAPESWEPFQRALAEALRRVDAHAPLEIHGLPMQSEGKENDDASVLDAFAARVPSIPFVAHRPTDHREVAEIVRGCDLVVAERFHALVIAATVGLPVFALAYDVKVAELAAQLGLDAAAVDINQPIDPAELAAALAALIDVRGAQANSVRERAMAARQIASQDLRVARTWVRARADEELGVRAEVMA